MTSSGITASALRRLDSSLSPEESALLAEIVEELHDMRRVQAYGQEDDLKEALGKVISRVDHLSERLMKMFRTQTELETALKLTRSNLQLSLANNEMLEDALRRESATGGKDIGWHRGSYSSSRLVSRQEQRTSADRENDKERLSSRQSTDVSMMVNAGTPASSPGSVGQRERGLSASAPGVASIPQSPARRSPQSPPTTNDGRFLRFRFSSMSTSPNVNSNSSSRPQSPSAPITLDTTRERDASHLTSASLPSLVSTRSKREEELGTELEAERVKCLKIKNEKASLEAELESLSQALFEEANKMVASERIRCAEVQEELRQMREEQAALRAAMRIIEEENAFLRNPILAPATAPADMRVQNSRPPPRSTESASSEPSYCTIPVGYNKKLEVEDSSVIPSTISRTFPISPTMVSSHDSSVSDSSNEADTVAHVLVKTGEIQRA